MLPRTRTSPASPPAGFLTDGEYQAGEGAWSSPCGQSGLRRVWTLISPNRRQRGDSEGRRGASRSGQRPLRPPPAHRQAGDSPAEQQAGGGSVHPSECAVPSGHLLLAGSHSLSHGSPTILSTAPTPGLPGGLWTAALASARTTAPCWVLLLDDLEALTGSPSAVLTRLDPPENRTQEGCLATPGALPRLPQTDAVGRRGDSR